MVVASLHTRDGLAAPGRGGGSGSGNRMTQDEWPGWLSSVMSVVTAVWFCAAMYGIQVGFRFGRIRHTDDRQAPRSRHSARRRRRFRPIEPWMDGELPVVTLTT